MSGIQIKVYSRRRIELALLLDPATKSPLFKETLLLPSEHLRAAVRTVEFSVVLVFPFVMPHHFCRGNNGK